MRCKNIQQNKAESLKGDYIVIVIVNSKHNPDYIHPGIYSTK